MSKRKNQRETAEKSIVRFARTSSASSTPTGYTVLEENSEQWPGPLATASAMIAERDEVKRLRLEAISQSQGGQVVPDDNVNFDQYDVKLRELSTNSNQINSYERKYTVDIPSLSDLCVNFISTNFESVSSLGDLSSELLEKISAGLAKNRKLCPEVALVLAAPGSSSLVLADCSTLSESDIIKTLEKVAQVAVTNETESSQKPNKAGKGKSSNKKDTKEELVEYFGNLRTLTLKNCGHGFGDRAALTLAHMGSTSPASDRGPGLETLAVTGCYRLADQCLSQLLEKCSSTLFYLDVSCNSRLGALGVKSVCDHLTRLRHLRLAFCTQLNDTEIDILSAAKLPALETLDIGGLSRVTDAAVERLLASHGGRLSGLLLNDCSSLTDKSLAAIRQHCGKLQSLDLGKIPLVSGDGLALLLQEARIGCLSRLGLGGLPVTDNLVLGLCRFLSASLEDLDLSGCSSLTAKALVMLMTHCQQMKYLDLSFVRTFSDSVLRAFVDACPYIRRVKVWGCSQLTTRIHDAISRPNLVVQGLSSAFCSN